MDKPLLTPEEVEATVAKEFGQASGRDEAQAGQAGAN